MPGLLALVKLRGKNQFRSRIGRGMASLLHYQILIEACLGNCSVPEEMITWASGVNPRNPVTSFTKLAINAAHLCGEIRKAVAFDHVLDKGDITSLKSALNTATILESKIQSWSYMFMSDSQRRPQTMPNPCLPTTPADQEAPKTIQTYPDMDTVSILNICRTVRSHLCCELLTLIKCLRQRGEALKAPNSVLESYCEQTTLAMQEEVCSSVPWILGEVNDCGKPVFVYEPQAIQGYCLLWPLKQILISGHASNRRKNWIRYRLEYIGDTLGMKMAIQFAREVKTE